MKLSARQDIDAPIEKVFARLADFEAWQRAAMRRGAGVVRTDGLSGTARGMSWVVDFTYRGRHRRLQVMLDEFVAPSRLALSGSGPNVAGTVMVDLTALTPHRTRMIVKLDVRPKTLVARLFLQSLKLARTRVDARFRERVAQLVEKIERGVA